MPSNQLNTDMTEKLPKVEISDKQTLETASLRDHEVFKTADPDGQVPDVVLATGEPNPRDRLHRNAQRVGIHDTEGEVVGAFNLVQGEQGSHINDVRIEQSRQGERLAAAAYLGTMTLLLENGRRLHSDPGGLSRDSEGVWQSLVRRGVARRIEGETDQHGHDRFVSIHPNEAKK